MRRPGSPKTQSSVPPPAEAARHLRPYCHTRSERISDAGRASSSKDKSGRTRTGRNDSRYTNKAYRQNRRAAETKPTNSHTTGTESTVRLRHNLNHSLKTRRPGRNRNPSRKSVTIRLTTTSGRHRDRLVDQTNKPETVPAGHTTPDRQPASLQTAALSARRPDDPAVRRTYLRYFLTFSMWRRLRLWYSLYTI